MELSAAAFAGERARMSISQPQKKRAEGVPVASCWNCKGAVSGAHFCAACGKIQLLPGGWDYFRFFGLPQKLTIDPAELEGQFHILSWKLHPDNFVRAREFERNLSLERSSELNDAYRTLREPISRVEYSAGAFGRAQRGDYQAASAAGIIGGSF